MTHLISNRKKDFIASPLAFVLLIFIIKIIATLFSIYVYARFSPFADAERYLNANFSSWSFSYLFNRTLFTDFVYAALKQILVFNTAVHLFISVLLSGCLWYVLKEDYKFINKPLLYTSLLLPHFLIWSGMVGKEALAIVGFLLFIKACVDLVVWNKLRVLPLLLGLFLGLTERPHYSLAYLYLFFISLLTINGRVRLMSLFSPQASWALLFAVLGYCAVFYNQLQQLFSRPLLQFMTLAKQYFLSFNANSNRWNILWENPQDFFINLPWGLPISIIGPTSKEALARPVFFPAFLEGCVALFLIGALIFMLLEFIKEYRHFRTVIIWGFIPALLLGLLINYPFGIFNPGSAIRYKQSLAPLMYFYPLLLMGAVQRKQSLKYNVT